MRLYLCEGDSADDTLAELTAWAVEDGRIRIVQHNTGIAHHAHSTRPERMKAVSENGNKGWEAIAAEAWGEYALMLESDLLYQPNLLRRLIDRMPAEADLFSPMIWIDVNGGLRFYDVWAFRRNGEMFPPIGPAWYANLGDGPVEIDSSGSVVLFKMSVITAGLRLSEETCILGLCNEARARGYRLFCDPATHVLHPSIEGIT